MKASKEGHVVLVEILFKVLLKVKQRLRKFHQCSAFTFQSATPVHPPDETKSSDGEAPSALSMESSTSLAIESPVEALGVKVGSEVHWVDIPF